MCSPPPAKSTGEGAWWESQFVLCNCLMPCNDSWIIVIKAFIRVEICFENGSINCLKLRGRKGILLTCKPNGKYLQRLHWDGFWVVPTCHWRAREGQDTCGWRGAGHRAVRGDTRVPGLAQSWVTLGGSTPSLGHISSFVRWSSWITHLVLALSPMHTLPTSLFIWSLESARHLRIPRIHFGRQSVVLGIQHPRVCN